MHGRYLRPEALISQQKRPAFWTDGEAPQTKRTNETSSRNLSTLNRTEL